MTHYCSGSRRLLARWKESKTQERKKTETRKSGKSRQQATSAREHATSRFLDLDAVTRGVTLTLPTSLSASRRGDSHSTLRAHSSQVHCPGSTSIQKLILSNLFCNAETQPYWNIVRGSFAGNVALVRGKKFLVSCWMQICWVSAVATARLCVRERVGLSLCAFLGRITFLYHARYYDDAAKLGRCGPKAMVPRQQIELENFLF